MKEFHIFKRSAPVLDNPFIGFTSFQHFDGDPLWSDIVVRPEKRFCETEDRECYPVPKDSEHGGDAEGFYPTTKIAYIRILWKEFEPERGQYNYDIIEDVLKKARACGHVVMFRLMPHSTCERDDLPDWLKALIPCPARPKGMRVKDSPTHPLFMELFTEAIAKIGQRFDSDKTLNMMDISLPGAWGEGHQWRAFPKEAIIRLVDAYLENFQNTHLLCACAPWVCEYIRQKRPCGWRADGVGHPRHLFDFYSHEHFVGIDDYWKDAPISFESYWWLGEWKRQGWDVRDVFERMLAWHVSHFNAKHMPIPHEWKRDVEYLLSKMGYHLAIRFAEYENAPKQGGKLPIRLTVENRGVAPIYEKLPFWVRLKGEGGEWIFDSNRDITKWLPGDAAMAFELDVPADMPKGEYTLSFGIFDDEFTVKLETETANDGKWYDVGTLNVGASQ